MPEPARTQNIHAPSKVEPRCPVFGSCGGCAYQDLPYAEELRIKTRALKDTLSGLILIPDEIYRPIVASPDEYGYRHRLDLTFLKTRHQGMVLGFARQGRFNIVPITSCDIARTEVSQALPELKKQVEARLPAAYRTASIVVKTGDGGQVIWGGVGRRSLRLEEKDYLWTKIEDKKIYYSMDTFFQANLSILPAVIEKVLSIIERPQTVFYDLYAGVGLFGLLAAFRCQKAVLVEENPASIRCAHFNVQTHELKNVEIHEGRAEEKMDALFGCDPELHKVAFVDPPRKGLGKDVLLRFAKEHRLKDLLYLSCNPQSLSGDLKHLTAAGWRIQEITPFDFFPKTRHLETLVRLTRHST